MHVWQTIWDQYVYELSIQMFPVDMLCISFTDQVFLFRIQCSKLINLHNFKYKFSDIINNLWFCDKFIFCFVYQFTANPNDMTLYINGLNELGTLFDDDFLRMAIEKKLIKTMYLDNYLQYSNISNTVEEASKEILKLIR